MLSMGKILAYGALMEGKQVTWMPAYGPEQRGGTANVTVVISDQPIASPILSRYDVVIALNQPSVKRFESKVKPGGILIYEGAGVEMLPQRKDIMTYRIDATEKAAEMSMAKIMNMIVLGALLKACPVIGDEGLEKSLSKSLPERYHHLIPANMQAVSVGRELLVS